MSDAKPRTSLRSYWHTLPKKKEQTPLKTGVRYNKAISVHLLTEPYVDVTAHTAPSQQAVSFPLEVMEVWINRHQTLVDRRFFFFPARSSSPNILILQRLQRFVSMKNLLVTMMDRISSLSFGLERSNFESCWRFFIWL